MTSLILLVLAILISALILRMAFKMEVLKMQIEALDVVSVVAWRALASQPRERRAK